MLLIDMNCKVSIEMCQSQLFKTYQSQLLRSNQSQQNVALYKDTLGKSTALPGED